MFCSRERQDKDLRLWTQDDDNDPFELLLKIPCFGKIIHKACLYCNLLACSSRYEQKGIEHDSLLTYVSHAGKMIHKGVEDVVESMTS